MFIQKSTTEKRGFDLKSNFHILFKTYRDKMQIQSLGKNPINYETVRKETHVFQQKLMSVDDFNDAEEGEVKEQANKGKARRQELAENKKLLKKQKKKKESKIKENEIWGRLAELNEEFKKIKKAKTEAKKMSEIVI